MLKRIVGPGVALFLALAILPATRCTAGKPGPAEYETPGHVDRAVIGTMASFIENGGGPSPQAASN